MMRHRSGIKTIPIIFAMLLIMGAFVVVAPNVVNAAQEGDYTYTVSGGNATITGYTGSGGNITIPSTLGGNPTLTIGASAFYGNVNVTSVTIPSSVTGIGNYAFQNCTNLTSITIPDGVTNIGASAFANCISLISAILPDNLTTIEFSLFSHCTSLISVIIPNSVTIIRDNAFRECSSLVSITLPNNLIFVGDAPFDYCTSLTSITIPSTVTKIRTEVFAYCSNLTSVFFLGNIQSIGANSFLNCRSLVSISFYGLIAPAILHNWINGTSSGLLGHAYAASNFPPPGDNFHGLIMGAVIPLVPGAPTNFVATPGNTHVDLTWNLPVGSSSLSIINYNVYRSASGNGTYSLIGAPNVLNYSDNALNNGQIYWYEVSAVNSKGEGAKTAPLSAMPYTVPNAPTGMNAVAGNSNVTLNWTAPVFDGANVIDYYIIYQDGVALPNHQTGVTTAINGLTNGQSYSFTVAAHNLAGLGAQSNTAVSTPFTVPNPPIGLTAISGSAKVTLNWTAPAFDGGRAIDYYVVYLDGVALAANVTGLNTTITGLENGQNYSFAIAAHNLAGVGNQSNSVSATPIMIPDAATGLTAAAGNGQVILNWTAPAHDGGNAIDYYVIYQDGVALADNVADLNTTIIGLTNGQQYSFSVAAHNAVGLSAKSNVANAIPYGVADAPIGLMAVAGSSNVTLNWTAPAFDGGRTIDYYIIYQDGVALPDHQTGLTTTVTGLTNGQSYSFTVAAHNLAGLGAQSNSVSAIPKMIPDAPTGLIAVAGNARVDLNWTAPANDGGNAIDYYTIYQDGEALATNVTGLNATINGLTNGQIYSFTVAAHNLAGIGARSTMVVSTPYTVPDAPNGFNVTAKASEVTLNWTAPAFDGGVAIDYYVVFQDGVALTNDVTGLNTTITGLSNGQNYSFSVAAHNLAGIGHQSNNVTVMPYTVVPGAPTSLVARGGVGFVLLNWTAPADVGNPPLTQYDVYRGTSSGVYGRAIGNMTAGILTYNDTTAVPGITYFYAVKAVSSAGLSPASNEVTGTAIALTALPSVPQNLVAQSGVGFIKLTWQAPGNVGIPPFTHYEVYRGTTSGTYGSPIGNVAAGTLIYNDTTTMPGTPYFYEVMAVNTVGSSPASNEVTGTATSGSQAPSAPQNLVATNGNHFVVLTWNAPANAGNPAFASYDIYRGVSADSIGSTPIGNVSAGTLTYNDTTAVNGNTYVYVVKAVNSEGQSSASNTAQGNPMSIPNNNETGSNNDSLYAGIGVLVVLVIIIGGLLHTRSKKKTPPKSP